MKSRREALDEAKEHEVSIARGDWNKSAMEGFRDEAAFCASSRSKHRPKVVAVKISSGDSSSLGELVSIGRLEKLITFKFIAEDAAMNLFVTQGADYPRGDRMNGMCR